MRHRLLAAAILSWLALPAFAAGTAAAGIALHCGKLFDSRSGRLLGPHTVVVRDGKVAEVLPGRAGATAGMTAIDLADRTCMAGWTDLHVHLGSQSSPQSYSEGFRLDDVDFAFRSIGYAEKTLMAGFTSVRDLGGTITPHLRDAINQGLVKGPRIWAAGKSIATTGGHADPTNGYNSELSHLLGPPGPTEGVINSVDDARQAVRQRYKDGSDVIKITATGGVLSYAKSGDAPQFTVEEARAIVDTARDYGYKVAAHAHGEEGMYRAVVAGVTSIEHGSYMSDRVMRLMKQKGTWYVPTLYAGRFVADKAKIDGYYPDIVRPKAARIGAQIQETAAKAYRNGVKIAFGTDMGVGPHGDNAREFAYMVEAGIPAAYALQAATIHAAEVLGVDDQGVVEPGKRADIIAMPGDPVADISNTMKVDFVMKDGVVMREPAR
ncbi:amidohydrolase family protein [Thermomonas sp. S9]|uniref:metal-dependent hydrolase family protein n=1 Tax=unclassified Thermomonas TaxID=2633315 RepID=UPI001AC2F392|nr:amidohydrolase family protein [Thermomonas sp. S9]MBN8715607.1 amidohydrolase family protein [Xanthomonadales bacterium]MBN8794509.1 amidohydrolase family protein [Stenotrophomonas nitritireducens]MCR6495715.1 amidohydrolase family protein [Thermomonas sp. S9]